MLMNELNKIFKKEFGRNLTTDEAWKMVEFVNLILENADKNLDKIIAQKNGGKN